MASYEEVEPADDVKDTRIWTSTVHITDDWGDEPTLYVLTKHDFHYFKFNNEREQVNAADAFVHGGDLEDVTAKFTVSIPLDSIVRVERLPGQECFHIRRERDAKKRWECIYCPPSLGGVLFRSLGERLRSRMRISEARQTIMEALALPLSVLFVVWVMFFLIWLGAKSDQEPKNETGSRPVYGNKWTRGVAGAKWLGGLLGETAVLALGCLVTLGIFGWAAVAATKRPMKRVLIPRRKGERVEKDERDDAEDKDEIEEKTARPRSGNGAPGKRGTKTRRKKDQKARLLGAIALVLGILAFLLGWIHSIQVVFLLLVLIGLGVGVAGILAAKNAYGDGQAVPIAGTVVNSLAFVFIVVIMFASHNKSADENKSTDEKVGSSGTATAESGENKQGTGMAAWGTPLDPDSDCTITLQGNGLVIDVPGTVHGLVEGVGRGNAPRVIREIEGDFSIQVKVRGKLHPQPNSHAVASGLPYQAGGLLLWDGPGHFVRFVRSGQDRKGSFQSVVAFTQRETDKMIGAQPTPVPEEDLYLRMERRGNEVYGSYSLDGKQWTPLSPLHGVFPTRVSVGVMALNNTHQPMSVRFEGLQITR